MLYKDLTSQPLELRDFSKIFKDLPFNPVQYKGKQKLNYRVTKQVLIDFFFAEDKTMKLTWMEALSKNWALKLKQLNH